MSMALMVLAAGAAGRMAISMWFLIFAVCCAFFFVISMLFGHDDAGDHDADHDTDHDTDHDADGDHDGGGSMSVFSLKVILAFGAGFGVGGYYGARFDLGWFGSSLCGVLGGLVMGGFAYALLNALYQRQGSLTVRADRLVGTTATVETTIEADGIGKVACTLPSGRESFQARSATGAVIALGTPVRVDAVHGSLLLVSPLT